MYQTERQLIPIKFRHKEERVPESLFCLCLKYVARNLDTLCTEMPNGYTLHDGLALPSEICEPFIETYQSNGGEIFDHFAHLFKDVTKTNLRSVHISNSSITDDGLEYLLCHDLYELTLTNCQNLTHKTYMNIFKHASNLRSLTIGPNVQITPYNKLSNSSLSLDDLPSRIYKKAPNLRHFVLRAIAESPFSTDNIFLGVMLDKLVQLRVLDLSYCLGVGSLRYLCKLTNLHTLILFDVPHLQNNDAILNICSLQTLVVLDISQTETFPEQGIYKDENKILALIVKCLPNLMSLDISGTNLAGKGTAEHSMCESLSGRKSDIPGLEYRVDNPLEFLGLYHTQHNACRRHDIPAKIISGDANEEQIFNAAASCMDKPKLLQNILNDLYHLLRYDQCTQIDQALDIVLEALTRYVKEKLIQISGSATLFYIVKNKDRPLLLNDITVKRRIITTLLTGMDYHNYDETMMRNGCLTLCQLRIPQDVMFEFKRLVQMLLHIVSTSDHEGFVQRIGIYLLNSVACQVNNKQKNELGDAGAIKKMMAIIKDRLHRRVCDDVLEVAWSTMWNVTDEAPKNCKRFLDGNGMKYFLGCLTTFPDKNELMRNMMGLLGNVAEVSELRSRLMQGHFIKVFSDLLFSTQDGIEVSYNAAGVIAHLASDGHRSWIIKTPSRYKVLDRMTKAIQNWNLDADRNINYRSFEPILQLAQVRHTPQCAHWAAWALANLTKVYPEKYCSIVIAEGGLRIMSELLEEHSLLQDNQPPGVIHSLAQTVINQCLMYMKNTVEESSQ
ncbi:protein zer-1 homolog [Rhopalosiphum maidis]|uniref:protein zer-1 homolog n=1 Tax=Rhopalosiphum maidis TaxID=43146 RepID=UPI000F00EE34|nr:protein zer-1 homolog [Rhopalosiphum maidis]